MFMPMPPRATICCIFFCSFSFSVSANFTTIGDGQPWKDNEKFSFGFSVKTKYKELLGLALTNEEECNQYIGRLISTSTFYWLVAPFSERKVSMTNEQMLELERKALFAGGIDPLVPPAKKVHKNMEITTLLLSFELLFIAAMTSSRE